MSWRAWAYIWSIFAAAAALLVLAIGWRTFDSVPWLPFVVMTGLATLAQLFVVEIPTTHVAYFATPIFVFAGLLLLEPWQYIALVVVYHGVEWTKERLSSSHRLRAWYIQPFNMATDVVAGMAARALYAQLPPVSGAIGGLLQVVLGAMTALTFVIVNHTVLGVALVLARKQRWSETGMLSAENVLSDMVLLLLGYVVAILWELNPWLILPALSPLLMMYRALRVPALEQEAQTDSKTGLLNPLYFTRQFEQEFARTQRFGRPLALIMADLDFLRNVNNTYGHLAGDIVIGGVGRIIAAHTREYDIAGRFGGEEFVVALPETTGADAAVIAERIRAAAELTAFAVPGHPDPIHVTLSLGVACLPGAARTTTDLTQEADAALYAAKAEGRNRVVGPGPHDTPPRPCASAS